MMDKQLITMVLKVDLQCNRCRKKVKKVLCKFPQIQDQVYDEKQNTVTIKVACVCPERIKKEIIRKAGKAVKGIDIVKPEVTVNLPKQPVETNPEPEMTKKPSEDESPDDNVEGLAVEKPDSPLHLVPEFELPVHTQYCVECYGEGCDGPSLHGSGCHRPRRSFSDEPYCNGYYGRSRPVWYECHVVQWESCPEDNYGPCRIM